MRRADPGQRRVLIPPTIWPVVACVPLILNDFVLIRAPGLMLRWPWEVGFEAVRWAFCWGCLRQLSFQELKAPWARVMEAILVGAGLALAWPIVWTAMVEGLGTAWWPARCHSWLPVSGHCAIDRAGWVLLGLSAAAAEEAIFWTWRRHARGRASIRVWWVATPFVFAGLHWCRYGGELIWLAGLRLAFNVAQNRGGYASSVVCHGTYNGIVLGTADACLNP